MKRVRLFFIYFASVALLGACEGTESTQDSNAFASSGNNVSLMKATGQDVSANVVECRGAGSGKGKKKGKQVCVAICHRPPGNPENSKSMVLPLSAVLAHLEHGGPNHGHHDTLGLCEGDGEDDMEDLDPEDPTYGNDEGSGDDTGTDEVYDSESDSDDGMDPGSDDGSSSDGSGLDMGGDNVGIGSYYPAVDEPNDIPQYCLDNLEVDPDCDGINDFTDDLLY